MLERAAISLRLRALDARDRLTGRADPLIPPRRRQFVGRGDFAATGEEFLAHFLELAGLAPADRVLEVGCGIGRMARPLARFLDPAQGSYEGFDVDREGIGWCRRAYARRHPNFRFQVADLYNRRYHPGGQHSASEYRFPYDDASFDLVIATSVFTHLLEQEADHYLAETARVLAPGGRLFATFFVLDDDSRGGDLRGHRRAAVPRRRRARRGPQRGPARGGGGLRRRLDRRAPGGARARRSGRCGRARGRAVPTA